MNDFPYRPGCCSDYSAADLAEWGARKAAENAVKEAMEEQKAEMKFIKIAGDYINPEAVDMIYCDDDANMFVRHGEKQASILLRSGQRAYVGRPLDEVKKMLAEATDSPQD